MSKQSDYKRVVITATILFVRNDHLAMALYTRQLDLLESTIFVGIKLLCSAV